MVSGEPDLERFSELVGVIHEGPCADPPWQCALEALRDAFGARDAYLILGTHSDAESGPMFLSGPAQGWVGETNPYTQGLYALDPFVNLPPNELVALDETLSPEALQRTDFYRLLLEPYDIFHILGADLRDDDGLRASLRLTRPRAWQPYGAAEKQLGELVLPHLRRAVHTYGRLAEIESERLVYAGAMTQLAVATFILDEERTVMSTNPLADRLVERADGIRLSRGRLELEHDVENARLRQMVRRASRAIRDGETCFPEAMPVERGGGRDPLGLIVRPVPPDERPRGSHGPAVAVFVSDPEQHAEPPESVLNQLYGLSPAEARLALRLANGMNVEEASEALGISPYTARAHLRSIFGKTNITKQTQLVRLVLRSVASLG